jgi:glutathione S-transferase
VTVVITAFERSPDGGMGLARDTRVRWAPSGLLDEFPNLAAYVARGEARPAYQRAFAAQWAINAPHSQAG